MSDIAKIRAEAQQSETFREGEFHSRRLGRAATDASGESWYHDEVMRLIRHAKTEWEIKEGLARLEALNASYHEAKMRTLRSRFGSGSVSVGANMAGGALAVLVLVGLSHDFGAIRPSFGAPAAFREDFIASPFDREKLLQFIGDRAAPTKCAAQSVAAQSLISFGGERSAAD